VAADAVKRLIQGFWAGSAERFLAGLVDENVLSAAELQRLAKKFAIPVALRWCPSPNCTGAELRAGCCSIC